MAELPAQIAIPRGLDGGPIVFFDGSCALCHRSVDFLVRHDPAGALRFARLEGDLARRVLPPELRDAGADGSIVLLEPAAGGRVSRRSEAVLRCLAHLPAPWRWAAPLARLRRLRPVLDAAYGVVARRRAAWFGGPDACATPDPRLRERLLD